MDNTNIFISCYFSWSLVIWSNFLSMIKTCKWLVIFTEWNIFYLPKKKKKVSLQIMLTSSKEDLSFPLVADRCGHYKLNQIRDYVDSKLDHSFGMTLFTFGLPHFWGIDLQGFQMRAYCFHYSPSTSITWILMIVSQHFENVW